MSLPFPSLLRSISVSELVNVVAAEPFALNRSVVANNNDHLVKLGAHLNATGETRILRVGHAASNQLVLLNLRRLVKFVEVGVRDMHRAHTAANTHGVPIERNLVRKHLVLLVTTIAVGVDSGHFVALKNMQKGLTFGGTETARNTIGSDNVDPDQVVSHFDAATFDSRAHNISSKGCSLNVHSGTKEHPSFESLALQGEHFYNI